jgi:hypothetical protein
MIGFSDERPDVNVLPGEYRRLLGYPPDVTPDERVIELEQSARTWYATQGRPWVLAREIDHVVLLPNGLEIGGVAFAPERLRKLVEESGADRLVLVAVSAGAEAEAYAARLWEEGKPDEYYFTEMYASAVVEHLVMMAGARLCATADQIGAAVLPHDSPGYPGWDVSEQPSLLRVLAMSSDRSRLRGIEVLESGMLRPKKSLLAAFGITSHVDRVRRLTDLVPCEDCALERCQFRRLPYRRGVSVTGPERPDVEAALESTAGPTPSPLSPSAAYSVNRKALRRWAAERLRLETTTDGAIRASFRYDGTTCTNMGRPIAWDFHVTLGPREEGYPITSQSSAPAPDDTGHTFMCRYISHGPSLMRAIADETPLAGQRLDDVLTWARAHAAAGCFCDAESRAYKWGLVFETIHHALATIEDERRSATPEETRP